MLGSQRVGGSSTGPTLNTRWRVSRAQAYLSALPCNPMQSHAIPCHPIPCHPTMPCHAVPCHAMHTFACSSSHRSKRNKGHRIVTGSWCVVVDSDVGMAPSGTSSAVITHNRLRVIVHSATNNFSVQSSPMVGRRIPAHGGGVHYAKDTSMASTCTLEKLEMTDGSSICLSASGIPVGARAKDDCDDGPLTYSLGCRGISACVLRWNPSLHAGQD